jgi:DNA repair exonuclease SbcCD ATPase subunit
MSQKSDHQKLLAVREYLHELVERDECAELELVIELVDQQIDVTAITDDAAEAAASGVEDVASEYPMPAFEDDPEPEFDPEPAVELKPEPEPEPVSLPEPEPVTARDRQLERRRRAQMKLDQLTAERIQAIKSSVLRCEEARLEALDKKDSEVGRLDASLQKIETRKIGIQRRREQTLKDEQTLRDEMGKRRNLIKEDEKALAEMRDHVARLQRELETARHRDKELADAVTRTRQRIRNEENALQEINSRRTQLDESEEQAALEVAALRKQRDSLQNEYASRFSKLEDEFLRSHWAHPPVSEDHLKEALKASATLLNVDERAVRDKLERMGLGDNLNVREPDFDAVSIVDAAPEPTDAHASLQNFLKLVKA